MVVDNFGLRLLGSVAETDLPQLDGLVGRRCNQHLLASLSLPHLLAQHIGDVVLVGWELLHGRSLVETKEVDLVVHSRKSVRALPKGSRRSQATLGHEETFLGLKVSCTELLDEAVHRSGHAHQRLDRLGSAAGLRGTACGYSIVKVDKHDLFLVRLLDFLLGEAAQFLELADRTAWCCRHLLPSCSIDLIILVSLAFFVPDFLLLFLVIFVIFFLYLILSTLRFLTLFFFILTQLLILFLLELERLRDLSETLGMRTEE